MTFRLLGLDEELRLAIEQAGGSPTEEARVIVEAAVQEAVAQVDQSLRELQSIIGPHGSITRLQAGGVRITAGEGIGIYADGVYKTQIAPRGDVIIGSDITQPSTTTEIFFVEDAVYNNEEFSAGDFLIGDNSTGNVKYDASAGQLQFRDGTTVQAYVGTDGKIYAGEGNVLLSSGGIAILEGSGQGFLSFYNAAGTVEEFAFKNDSDVFTLISEIVGGRIDTTLKLTDESSPSIRWGEHSTTTNATLLSVEAGAAGGVVNFFDTFIVDGRTDDRLEIGQDHYFPTRSSANPNGFWNEANQDMDFTFEGDTAAIVLKVDAGLDAVGIGGAAESGYKLKVTGDVNLTAGNTYDIDGSPHAHTYSNLIGGNGVFQTVAASTTSALALYASGLVPVGANAPLSKGGTLKNLYVRIAGTQPASGNMVFTIMINNAASSITCTQAAGAIAATISDTTHTEAVSAGDLVYLRVVNNATGASANLGVFMLELETTTA
jgi:hypothetical protein